MKTHFSEDGCTTFCGVTTTKTSNDANKVSCSKCARANREHISENEFPRTSTLPMCSAEQTAAYIAKAKAFIKSTAFYSSMASDAACAVAEYMASVDGFTIRDWS